MRTNGTVLFVEDECNTKLTAAIFFLVTKWPISNRIKYEYHYYYNRPILVLVTRVRLKLNFILVEVKFYISDSIHI